MNSIAMRSTAAAALVILAGTIATAATVPGLPPAAAEAMATIAAPRIAAHVQFLASNLLQGRGTGAIGGDIAAEYIATQFALDGLQPAGDGGGYLQKVKFVGATLQPRQTTFTFVPAKGETTALKFGDDFVLADDTAAPHDDIDAPIVYVGFGISAPEFGWDDFKGTDLRGKILLMFVNEPESKDPNFFGGPALTYYGRWTYKYEEAARRGAVGAIIIHRTDLASYGWDVVRSSWSGEEVQLVDDAEPKLKAAAWVRLEVARKLLAASGLDLDAMYRAANRRDFRPIELPVRLKAHIESDVRHFESSNVVALRPGASAEPPRQVVVYSAHYDHLGIVPGTGADAIYNGAVDNGTGCGILLELAHAFATAQAKPPHPILFAAVTAEEKGLLGSEYLGRHLPMAPADVALAMNYDAINPLGEPQSITVTGAERTDFYPVVQSTATSFGLAIEPDAEPGAGHYYRSDHFSFARVGIPSFSIDQGVLFAGHTREWGVQQSDDYVEHRYHQPSDEFRPDMDFSGNALLARFGFALGWLASSQPRTIEWKPGDEFEAARRGGTAK
jgi:Zn-dependent M28 family amino/carboxypeptidase